MTASTPGAWGGPGSDDRAHEAPSHFQGWVLLGAGLTLVAYIAIFVAGIVSGSTALPVRVGEGVSIVVLVAAVFIAHRGRPRSAGLIVLVAVGFELHLSLFLNAYFPIASMVVLPAFVLGAGLFRGGAAALATAVTLSVVPVALIALGGAVGHGPGLDLRDDLTGVLITAATLLVTGALVQRALAAFGDVLAESRRNARRSALLVAQAPDGIVVVDDQLRVREANPAVEELLGQDRDALIGWPIAEVAGPLDAAEWRRVLDGVVGVEGSVPEILHIQPREGEARVVELTARRLDDLGAREPATQIMLRDVTERARARERARELGRILQEAGSEIIVFRPADLSVVEMSRGAREKLGLAGDDPMPGTIDEINPALTRTGVPLLEARLAASGERQVRLAGVHTRHAAGVYPVEAEFSPAHLDGHEVIVAVVRDLTEQVQAEGKERRLQEQLEHAQRMEAIGHLAGGVAHDFNNLLTVIGGIAEVLSEEVDEGLQELVEELRTAQLRGASLTRQLLLFARRPAGRREVLDTGEVMRGVERLVRRLAGEQVAVELVLAPELPPVMADPGQLEQLLLNLVANARDAMPDGGTVRVEVREGAGGDELHLTVTDTGSGMPRDVIDRIFEPFFTTKPEGAGTGLGLATVSGIVTGLGGRIEVDSVVGSGTTFHVVLPTALDVVEGESATEAAGGLRSDPVRVLLIEDAPDTRAVVQRLLERDGHTVCATASGIEALALPDDIVEDMDLVVTDVVMPGPSGIETVERLEERGLRAPVVFMSGYMDERIHGTVPDRPDRRFLSKPFSGAQLRDVCSELLGNGPSLTPGPGPDPTPGSSLRPPAPSE